jgi:N-acetyl-anhydromuramyl-L-alanine amidase AmpD
MKLVKLAMIGLAAMVLGGCVADDVASTQPNAPTRAYRDPSQIRPNNPFPQAARPPAATSSGVSGGAFEPPTRSRPWQFIVIHHSATPGGSAAAFDRAHRGQGWDSLGYHFVIGNGNGSGNGIVERGPRWSTQKHGAHTKTADNRYNELGIGICLVGNFDTGRPSQQQIDATARLVGWLMARYNIPPERVIGHGQAKPTACPGKNFPLAALKQQAARIAAASRGPAVAAR